MGVKDKPDQKLAQRAPLQERARYKVELILEAASRLLASGGLEALTTNAVAQTAGVSIGTLYQYFANKEAILDALGEREMAALSERVVAVLSDPAEMPPEDRVAAVIRAVMASYGGRLRVHRLVMEHSLSRGTRRLEPLIARLVGFLTANGPWDGEGQAVALSHADAFVLTNAFAGVMRGMILWQDGEAPSAPAIEESLQRLIIGFAEGAGR